jgi:hypothetical protein
MNDRGCGCPIMTGGQVHNFDCSFWKAGIPTSACRHPYARIRRAMICMDCGAEVPLTHFTGDPALGITAGCK